MKPLGDAIRRFELKLRHRRWHWSRHFNGFCDKPLWRVVAVSLGVPLSEIIAFVMRLEEFANAAEQRGQVHHFVAAEFAAALDISPRDAARIFEELERVGWIKFGAVGDFHDRNRDEEKEAVNERKRRERGRETVRKLLSELARLGLIEPVDRNEIEAELYNYTSAELDALKKQLRAAKLSTKPTPSRPSRVTGVTVTAEQTKNFQAQAVDDSGDSARGAEEGLSGEEVAAGENDPQAAAVRWIAIEGRRIAIARMPHENPGRVDTLLARWCDQDLGGDAVALMTVLLEVNRVELVGGNFHVAMTAACSRWRQQKAQRDDPQKRLPLGARLKTVGGNGG